MNSILAVYTCMFIFYLVFSSANTYQVEKVCGKKSFRVKPMYAILYALPLVIFAWQRDQYIGDTNSYIIMFKQLPGTYQGLLSYLELNPKDPGFTIFAWMIKSISLSDRGFFLIIAIIQTLCLVYIYRKYSCNYYLSALLFVISTDYFSWMQNGIRQFLAVVIIFASTPWILEKKYIREIMVILLASSFHQSALLMIPVIFIVQGDALNKRVLLISMLFIISITFISGFTDLLDSALQETQYSNMVSDFREGSFSNDDGTNPLRVLVYSVPLILGTYLVLKNRGGFTPIINLSINMTLFSVGFYLISLGTSGIFIGRIPIYFSLYNYILIPYELNRIFVKNQVKLIIWISIIMYLIFSYFQFNISWM